MAQVRKCTIIFIDHSMAGHTKLSVNFSTSFYFFSIKTKRIDMRRKNIRGCFSLHGSARATPTYLETYILNPIHTVGNWRSNDTGSYIYFPQQFTIISIESREISIGCSLEYQS